MLFACKDPGSVRAVSLPIADSLKNRCSVDVPYVVEFSSLLPLEALHILVNREDAMLRMVPQCMHDDFDIISSYA